MIESVLEQMPRAPWQSIDDVLAADREARRLASEEDRAPRSIMRGTPEKTIVLMRKVRMYNVDPRSAGSCWDS